MKKITLHNKKYEAKNLFGFGVFTKGSVFLKKKEKLLFSKGIIAVKFDDGIIKYYEVGTYKKFMLYYYCSNEGEEEIVFEDPEMQKSWVSIFVYMYDEDGAGLLMANKELLDSGAHCEIRGAAHASDIERCALNSALLFDSDLLARLKRLDSLSYECQEETFLEVDCDC